MPGTRVVIDGLWKCLCPSFDSSSLRVARLSGRRQAPSSARDGPLRLKPNRIQTRPLHLTAVRHDYYNLPRAKSDRESKPHRHLLSRLSARPPSLELRSTPVPIIYDALRELRDKPGAGPRIKVLVKHLLEKRGEKPNALTYELLMWANARENGSADEIRELLKQMRENGVDGTPGLYHAVLQALAVHPDYLLRNSIINEMRDRWIDIAPEGWHSVVVGLLRDGQYEMALDKLEDLAKTNVAIPDWVYDTFIYTFGQVGFFDDALKIMNHRLQDETAEVSLNVWYFLLDICSSGYHHEGTKYVWNRMVQSKLLVPSDGMMLNVLYTAARAHDAKLADQATQYLVSRGIKLGVHHFEALLDCYAGANDVDSALEGLCIMTQAGIQVDQSTTRSIYRVFKQNPALVDPAVKALFDLATKHSVPIAAFNVVLEGMLSVSSGPAQVDHALNLYRHVRQVCPAGPDIATFHLLLQTLDGNAQLVAFFTSEMEAFTIQPDSRIFDALVRAAVRGDDLDLAMRYVFELIKMNISAGGAGPWITEDTAVQLIRRCAHGGTEDPRVWEVLEACRARGMDLDWARKKDWPGAEGDAEQTSETGQDDKPLQASTSM